MKLLLGTEEYLNEVNQRINDGLDAEVKGYSASQYSTVTPYQDQYALSIDPDDLRNPLKLLTPDEINSLIDAPVPVIETIPVDPEPLPNFEGFI